MQTLPEWQIMNIVDGIDNAVDAKDWARARAYFTEIIYVDFSSLSGDNPGEMPAANLINNWQKNLYAGKNLFTCGAIIPLTSTAKRLPIILKLMLLMR